MVAPFPGRVVAAAVPRSLAPAQPRQQPVHGTIAQGFDQMRSLDGGVSRQIGDGARYPQDAVPGPDAEPQLLDGTFQKFKLLR